MSATFDEALTTAKDRVRRLLGDADIGQAMLSDATIQGAIDIYGEPGAVAFLAEGLAAEYGQLPVSTSADGTTLDYSERVKTWQALAKTMRATPPVPQSQPGGSTFGVTRTERMSTDEDEYGRSTVYAAPFSRGWWWRR